jgi:hypothetical protein
MVVSENRNFGDDHFVVEQLTVIARIVVTYDFAAKLESNRLSTELVSVNSEEIKPVVVAGAADLDEVDFSH